MHARGAPPPRGKSDGHLRSPLRPTRAFHYSTARARPPDSKCPAGPAPVARSCMRGAPPGAGRSIWPAGTALECSGRSEEEEPRTERSKNAELPTKGLDRFKGARAALYEAVAPQRTQRHRHRHKHTRHTPSNNSALPLRTVGDMHRRQACIGDR